MGVSDLEFDTNGPVVDLSARGMRKLDPSFVCSEDTHTLILDHNQIMKLDHLERNPGLQQLSVASNRLVRMMGVSQLTELQVLNLPNNSIGYIEGLRDLPNLKWLNLSGNAVKVIEQLSNCVSLQHLDLSDNSISNIGDLSKLVALKTLLLHGNSVTTLRTVPANLPAPLSILSLASNEITDLNEVAYLASLHELEQLSIMNNPCVMPTPSLPRFDYRPYVMSWCLNLKVLDGFVVSQKEGLKAEWLYSQGKGRSYRPGQHVQLVQYLSTVCLRTSSSPLVLAEDAKLEKILTKQRFHQMQLLEETRRECPSPPRPTQLAVEKTGPLHALPQGGAIERQQPSTPSPAAVLSEQEKGPAVQFNTWVSCDSPGASLPHVCSPIKPREESLCLEDVQTDEDKLNSSVLSSESSFLPFTPDPEPRPPHSDSEDETETFEADSLAPALPRAAPPEREHKEPLECAVVIGSRAPHPEAQKEEEHLKSTTKQSACEEGNRAAVKIQSWWRGQYTRCWHPAAREVRSEIRLRRMQDHIIFLTEKLDRVQKQCDEERLQRLVQEDAVRFLWQQVQSMLQWKQSVDQQLLGLPHIAGAPCQAAPPPTACSTNTQAATDMSFPDSGFQASREERAAREDRFLSSGTGESVMTVRAPSPGGGADITDCSLLERYASSLQQREEEDEAEEVVSDHSVTPRPSSPVSPGKSEMRTAVTETEKTDLK